jgi:hypothetical protein
MTKREQRIGSAGQEKAAAALRAAGVEMVEKIATPVKLIRANVPGTYRVIFGETVSGDHRGILPDGTSVLAETKTILNRNLRYSDLRDHQPGRLTEHHEHNGVSLLVWVHSSGIYIMRWPIPLFVKGKSISQEEARLLCIESL